MKLCLAIITTCFLLLPTIAACQEREKQKQRPEVTISVTLGTTSMMITFLGVLTKVHLPEWVGEGDIVFDEFYFREELISELLEIALDKNLDLVSRDLASQLEELGESYPMVTSLFAKLPMRTKIPGKHLELSSLKDFNQELLNILMTSN